jgi:hypothetical protein
MNFLRKGVPVWAAVHSKARQQRGLERQGGNGWRMTTPLFAFRKEFTTRKEEIHFHAK